MPVLAQIRSRFAAERPLAGIRVAACLHVTAETANLVRTLAAGGATVALCSANPLSTQDDAAAALVLEDRVEVRARRGEDVDTYVAHVLALLDTADGAFMAYAYGWAFSNPVRKVYYNITVTALSVTVALGIGGAELVQLVARAAWLDVNTMGYAIVALFAITWAASALVWKTQRIEQRWTYRGPTKV